MISRMGKLISSSRLTLEQVKARFPQWFIAKLEENQDLMRSYPFYDYNNGDIAFTTLIGNAGNYKDYTTTISYSNVSYRGREIVTVTHENIAEIGIIKSLSIHFVHSRDVPIKIEGDIYRFLFPERNV